MPIPVTRNVGKTMSFLKEEKPGMPGKQKIAIALSTARKAGANIPVKKDYMSKMKERSKNA